MSRARRRKSRKTNIFVALAAFILASVVCVSATMSSGLWFVRSVLDRNPEEVTPSQDWSAESAELTVAVSPVMADVFEDLANRFNSLDHRTPDGRKMTVWVTVLEPEKMVDEALGLPPFQAISPDSSLWLDQIEQRWAERSGARSEDVQIPIGQVRVGERDRYAVSPIVIAAWESVARELGWPDNPIGWEDIQRKATEEPDFKWNHASTNNASGLLATLAEFYAGAGLTRGLSAEAATAQPTLDYVQAVESTIRFYGEGEQVITQRLAEEGRSFLDAFVAQERVVLDWNAENTGERLVAIYPAEGTLWTDHPLALLELGSQPHELAVTENQRSTFREFANFLLTEESQLSLLQAGYRPANLSIELNQPPSPFAGNSAVDWREPQTTLQMPSPAVVDVVRNVWYYTKRPTNVYLVVDTSGSMEGAKIARTREALSAFVSEIQGDRDRIGMVEFGSGTKSFAPLQVMNDENRADLLAKIDRLEAYGGTALIDAVYEAANELRQEADDRAINALVVMTDGLENESRRNLNDLLPLFADPSAPDMVVFTIAFGRDADEPLLSDIARIGGGQFRRADETEIEELYRIISTYF